MDPITMMMLGQAISQGVPALAQAGIGIHQGIKAKKMERDLHDPIYSVPDAIDQSIAMYADRANTNTMAGYDNAVQKLDQGMSNTTSDILNAAGSGGDALGALVKANATNQGAMNDLAYQNARVVDSYDTDLIRAIAGRAEYEDKAFQINVLDKFNRDAAAVSAMKNAAINNVFGGVKSLSKATGDVMGIAAGGEQGVFGGLKTTGDDGNISGDIVGASAVPQRVAVMPSNVTEGTVNMTPEQRDALEKALLYRFVNENIASN